MREPGDHSSGTHQVAPASRFVWKRTDEGATLCEPLLQAQVVRPEEQQRHAHGKHRAGVRANETSPHLLGFRALARRTASPPSYAKTTSLPPCIIGMESCSGSRP